MSHVDVGALLTGLGAGVPELRGARCAGSPQVWDPQGEGEDVDDWRYRRDAARRLCRGCPALQACGEWLDSIDDPEQKPLGVVAGRLVRRPAWRPKVAV